MHYIVPSGTTIVTQETLLKEPQVRLLTVTYLHADADAYCVPVVYSQDFNLGLPL